MTDYRIGDAERDAICDELSWQHAVGRLSPAEVDQRLSLALQARSGSELVSVVHDLPPRRTLTPSPAPAVESGIGVVIADILIIVLVLAAGVCTIGLILIGGIQAPYALLGAVGGFTVGAGMLHLTRRSRSNPPTSLSGRPGLDYTAGR